MKVTNLRNNINSPFGRGLYYIHITRLEDRKEPVVDSGNLILSEASSGVNDYETGSSEKSVFSMLASESQCLRIGREATSAKISMKRSKVRFQIKT